VKSDDFDRFTGILSAVFEVYGKERSPTAAALWWKLLERFDLAQVEAALAEHMGASKFAPTPADVITILTARDGRPTADEAWSMVPRSEHESVCWTDEIAKAYGVAQPLLAAGDAVAARRAFIDRYEFEVSAARKVGAPVRVWFSWGWDKAARIGAVGRALELGMIRPEVAQKYAAQLPNGSDIAPKIAAMIGGTTKRLQ
jgi:hypothetical protein